ncbi:MAG: hydantoinase/oxoprolinase family protein [Eggerthellaceae bacterium]|nr:hydantoinase/oxoprolinase family protein [Eggerthellaceae bacterium]
MIGIGIDTGGTFTDGVVYDMNARKVLASCKTLTTHDNLSACIGAALDKLPAEELARAQRVSLSTTLATNACVEGKGGHAKLVIVGTTDALLKHIDVTRTYGIPYSDVLALPFDGSADGSRAVAPDWPSICDEHDDFFSDADSFGIAGIYALNNGAIAERTGAEYLEGRYGKPVVMATSVATSLNVIERGATALLNARLIPVIDEFIHAMEAALEKRRLDIPITIVRSNGSLMSARFAQSSPVETIVSGPAASAVGALSLAESGESLVVDIGGTTSDICVVHSGRPVSSAGIRIGRWRTQVKGADIDTIGLGGDSAVRITQARKLELSPRRVLPLCMASTRWPNVVKDALEMYLDRMMADYHSYYQLLYLAKAPENLERYNDAERAFLELVADGPVGLLDHRLGYLAVDTSRLENEGTIMRCGMTPTDAMHLKGDFTDFDVEASRLGALCLLQTLEHNSETPDQVLIDQVADSIYDLAKRKLHHQIARVLVQDRYPALRDQELSPQIDALIDDAWERFRTNAPARPFDIDFTTSMTLIGIGAPTHVFLPDVAHAFKAPYVVPDHAEVANAVGAICACVTVEETVHITPHRTGGGIIDSYNVSSRESSSVFKSEQDAIEYARTEAERIARDEARRRGAHGSVSCETDVEKHVLHFVDASTAPVEWLVTAVAQGSC